MELDKTRIAVRERNVVETLDLSLHVTRFYALPLLVTMALGVVPLLILNELLVGWLETQVDNELDYPFRYVWFMSVLVFFEAPLASVFATTYLGLAVFEDRPSIGEVARRVAKHACQLAWCHLLVRGVGLVWLLALSLEGNTQSDWWIEGGLMIPLIIYAAALRSMRPFINEIVLLEQNPLMKSADHEMTIYRRSVMLHSAAGGDLLSRFVASAIIGTLLILALFGLLLFCSGVFLHDWGQGHVMLRLLLPLCMWLVVGFLTVFRFLSYMDTRIRQEGWEVSLLLRAEASRLAARTG